MSTWEQRNAAEIKRLGLTTRDRDVPDTGVVLGMEPGLVYAPEQLPRIDIAPGVSASLSWGRGTLLEALTFTPEAQYPEEELRGETMLLVEGGSGVCQLDGQWIELQKGSFLYLTEGMKRSLVAGPDGLEALDISSPVRADHLAQAGVPQPEGAGAFPLDEIAPPSHQAGVRYQFDELEVTPIVMPGQQPGDPEQARTRLVWGRHFMLSFVEMDPGITFPLHIHPEDQLMLVREGAMEEGIIDQWLPMRGDRKEVILQPGGMIHGAQLSPEGARVVDIFWPVRPDYIEMRDQQRRT